MLLVSNLDWHTSLTVISEVIWMLICYWLLVFESVICLYLKHGVVEAFFACGAEHLFDSFDLVVGCLVLGWSECAWAQWSIVMATNKEGALWPRNESWSNLNTQLCTTLGGSETSLMWLLQLLHRLVTTNLVRPLCLDLWKALLLLLRKRIHLCRMHHVLF